MFRGLVLLLCVSCAWARDPDPGVYGIADISETLLRRTSVEMAAYKNHVCDLSANIVIGCYACEHSLLCVHPDNVQRANWLSTHPDCYAHIEYCMPLTEFRRVSS